MPDRKLPDKTDFGAILGDFVKDVNVKQNEAKSASKEFMMGGDIELHEVMIAGQKAKTSLDLLMEIRNKSLNMYRELTRMQ
ncbi:MAG: flagellar hook-basal body complex protein FliE [Ignavibacteriales bacterium]|nr:flagellar hook-basal body complex protein FliE [Ignavibacteriales bacterium]